MKLKVIIRADGGSPIGMGHVVRSLALADILKDDFEIVFAIQQPDESVLETIREVTQSIILLPITSDYSTDASNFLQQLVEKDIVVLDSYNFKTEYQQKVKSNCHKLVCIDDLHAWHHVADVIINHAAGVSVSEYDAENYTMFCLGLDYALLRKPFLIPERKPRKIYSVSKVFISMGAADIDNITQKFTEALLFDKGIEEIHLMLGSINPHLKSIDNLIQRNKQINIIRHFNISAEELKELLLQCDVAICPASSISLECCAIGIGLISGFTAENQLGILAGLKQYQAAFDFGNMNLLTHDEIKSKLLEVFSNTDLVNEKIDNQLKMIDGKSPDRFLKLFRSIIGPQLHFRCAQKSDADLYFKWTNDELVRINSYNQAPVSYEEHLKWFNSKINSDNCWMYLFLNENEIPIGQVRIDKVNEDLVIGISIDENFRGKNLSVQLLISATSDFLDKNQSAVITAFIKETNIASYKAFISAGFEFHSFVIQNGIRSFKMTKK